MLLQTETKDRKQIAKGFKMDKGNTTTSRIGCFT